MSSVELARLSLTRTPGGIAVKLTDWRRDCTSKKETKRERERNREREKKVISTQHNFLLISLPLALGVAKCQACKLYIYKNVYVLLCVYLCCLRRKVCSRKAKDKDSGRAERGRNRIEANENRIDICHFLTRSVCSAYPPPCTRFQH